MQGWAVCSKGHVSMEPAIKGIVTPQTSRSSCKNSRKWYSCIESRPLKEKQKAPPYSLCGKPLEVSVRLSVLKRRSWYIEAIYSIASFCFKQYRVASMAMGCKIENLTSHCSSMKEDLKDQDSYQTIKVISSRITFSSCTGLQPTCGAEDASSWWKKGERETWWLKKTPPQIPAASFWIAPC